MRSGSFQSRLPASPSTSSAETSEGFGRARSRSGKDRSTRGITLEDLTRLYLTVGYGWADQILQKYGAAARLASDQNDRLRILQDEQRKIVQQMYGMAGLPPPDYAR